MKRNTLRAALISCAIAVGCSTSGAFAQQSDLKREVMSTIDGAIRLLEAKQYSEFVKTYFRPSELEELVAKFGAVDKLAAEFVRQERHLALLKLLQAAMKSEPTFERQNTIAIYRFDPPIGKDRSLSLQKIGDRWFLRD